MLFALSTCLFVFGWATADLSTQMLLPSQKLRNFSPPELGAIVGDDRIGYAETVNNVSEEGYHLLGADIDDGSSLNPLGELVNRYEEISEAPGRLSEWSHHVEVPDDERPRDGDGLEHLCREVSLSSVELAPFTASYDVLGVHHRRGPVVKDQMATREGGSE
jgi:hypothetical protein